MKYPRGYLSDSLVASRARPVGALKLGKCKSLDRRRRQSIEDARRRAGSPGNELRNQQHGLSIDKGPGEGR
jgi:hypothetical protein